MEESTHSYLVGQRYTFPDGNSLTITQIKRRDDGFWVTFLVRISPSIPRMQVMPIPEFLENYGHLFAQKS